MSIGKLWDDPAHRIIFDKNLTYEPVKVYDTLPIVLPKPTEVTTTPPDISEKGKFHDFTDDNVQDSFFLSVASILAVHNFKLIQKTTDLRELAVKEIKKGVLGLKLRDFQFNNNYNWYKEYLEDFKRGKTSIDDNFFLIEATALALYRPIILVSTLPQHRENPIVKFNMESTKPPLILLCTKMKAKYISCHSFWTKMLALFCQIYIIKLKSSRMFKNNTRNNASFWNFDTWANGNLVCTKITKPILIFSRCYLANRFKVSILSF